MKRLQVPIGDEAIWEYDVKKVADFAVSKLQNAQVFGLFVGLDYNLSVSLEAALRKELENEDKLLLYVARQMAWADLDPERDGVPKSTSAKIDLSENWDLVKHDKIKVR